MLENYKKFLIDFDELIEYISNNQKEYIQCKKGCAKCCQKGNYPFSQLEFTYLTQGYINLDENTKILVQQNIQNLLLDKKEFKGNIFEHECPFLINNECCVYNYRGIICRTFGVCYYDDDNQYVRLPDCVNYGLNYSHVYDKKSRTLKISDVPKINLRIDKVLNSSLAKKYNLECSHIKPLLEWIEK